MTRLSMPTSPSKPLIGCARLALRRERTADPDVGAAPTRAGDRHLRADRLAPVSQHPQARVHVVGRMVLWARPVVDGRDLERTVGLLRHEVDPVLRAVAACVAEGFLAHAEQVVGGGFGNAVERPCGRLEVHRNPMRLRQVGGQLQQGCAQAVALEVRGLQAARDRARRGQRLADPRQRHVHCRGMRGALATKFLGESREHELDARQFPPEAVVPFVADAAPPGASRVTQGLLHALAPVGILGGVGDAAAIVQPHPARRRAQAIFALVELALAGEGILVGAVHDRIVVGIHAVRPRMALGFQFPLVNAGELEEMPAHRHASRVDVDRPVDRLGRAQRGVEPSFRGGELRLAALAVGDVAAIQHDAAHHRVVQQVRGGALDPAPVAVGAGEARLEPGRDAGLASFTSCPILPRATAASSGCSRSKIEAPTRPAGARPETASSAALA